MAQIEGIHESFSGTGDYQSIGGSYDGLDNPGWAIGGTRGTGGELTENGLEFFTDSISAGGRAAQQELRKELVGQSSFSEELRLKNLSLGEITDDMWGSGSGVIVEHFFGLGELVSRVIVELIEPSVTDDVWRFIVHTPGNDREEQSFVPRSDDLVITMKYDQQLSTFFASYDADVSDGEPPNELALPLDMELSAKSEVRFTAATAGQVRNTGVLNAWSLMPISGIVGDFNGNGLLDAGDIDLLSAHIRAGANDSAYDLNADSLVNDFDRQIWVHDLKQTYFGDADFRGTFDSTDLVQVLSSGEYEDNVALNSTWLTGDWDGDGEFTSSDLVVALADGGYEAVAAAVPEPAGVILAVTAGAFAASFGRRYSRTRHP